MQQMIYHVDRLCVQGLVLEQDHPVLQHVSLSFFEFVSWKDKKGEDIVSRLTCSHLHRLQVCPYNMIFLPSFSLQHPWFIGASSPLMRRRYQESVVSYTSTSYHSKTTTDKRRTGWTNIAKITWITLILTYWTYATAYGEIWLLTTGRAPLLPLPFHRKTTNNIDHHVKESNTN